MSRAWQCVAAAVVAVLLAPGGRPGAAQQVSLPLSQYEDLRTRARTSSEPAPAPPSPFALESDDLDVIAGPASARIVQRLAVRLLAAGWQAIPLGSAGSFVAADLGGLEGRVAESKGGLVLEVRGEGEHRVRLESVVPVTQDPTSTRPIWRFVLRPPAAAVARGVLSPAPGLAGKVEEAALGAGALLQGGRQGGPWSFAATPGKEIEVRLLGRALLPERARLALRFEATAASAAVLSRTRIKVHSWVAARVAQGRLSELRLRLPEGFTVEAVGPAVAGWEVKDGTLAVTPLEPVETTLQLAVELTGPPRDAFAAPLLVPEGAVRTTLLARAILQGDGLLALAEAGATRPPDRVEAAPLAADPAGGGNGKLYLVTDPARPPRWQAEWADRTEVLASQVDGLWVELTAGESGRATYQLWAEVRNRAATQLELGLPPGFELIVASRDGVILAPGMTAGRRLAVPLLSRESPQLVHLLGVMPFALPREAGDLAVPLPALSAPAGRVHVRLLLPGGRSYALADATRAAAGASLPPRPAAAVMAVAAPAPGDLAGQLLLRPAETSAPDVAAPAVLPAGWLEVAAAWSALSATPAPLALRVTSRKERESWF